MDIWTIKSFLDPLKTLRFSHFPWAVDWNNRALCLRPAIVTNIK
jgi:hypothetical protein